MASNAPGKCCAQGFRHEGEAKGTISQFGGVESYLVGDKSSSKVLLFLTDVIGHKFINAQLLADQFAESGYYVVMPDLFKGDPVPLNPPEGFDLLKTWFPGHVPEITKPIVTSVIDAIHSELKPKYVVATGYCFGAKYAVQLLGEKKIQAAGVAHPSFVSIDEVKAIKGPLFIAGAETDTIYTEDLRRQTEDTLREIKATFRTTFNSGVVHGFAVRADLNDTVAKKAKERAFCDMVDWFEQFAPSA